MKKLTKSQFEKNKLLFIGYATFVREKEREFSKVYNSWEKIAKELFGIDYDKGFYHFQDHIFDDDFEISEAFNDMIGYAKEKDKKNKKE